MKMVKLDRYDYELLPGIIRISLSGENDPDLVDIMSELNRANGRIYVEEKRFSYLDYYQIMTDEHGSYIDLHAEQL